MALMFHDKELTELMEDFYILTGMRIVLFDENFTELVSYPMNRETFCTCMRKNNEFAEKCHKSDNISFCKCRDTRTLNVYKCHAGLIEATAPILENNRIIGYMMFGQITDMKNRNEFLHHMERLCIAYGADEDMNGKIRRIKYRSGRQILAAAKILDACTGYIQLKDMVHLSGRQLIEPIEAFVDEHMSEEITVERICREFGISRTKLYKLTGEYIEGGIASFIKHKRLEKAKHLIRTTDLPISRISDEVGFSDYNYFLREFKRKYGISSRACRKQYKECIKDK